MLEFVTQAPDIFIVKLSGVSNGNERRHPRHAHPLPKRQVILWTSEPMMWFLESWADVVARQIWVS